MRGKFELTSLLARGRSNPMEILLKLDLRQALLGCKSVLDVGGGKAFTMRELGVEHAVSAEGHLPTMEAARKLKTHHDYVYCDVRKLAEHFQPGQFDACIALDVIEHLDKAGGLKLLADMERIARRRVVIFTPSGFLPQGQRESGDLQAHHSGWEPQEMEQLGYRVTGAFGPKKLRGAYHALKHRPVVFWGMVSLAGQIVWSKHHPEAAAAIIGTKSLPGDR